MKIKTTTSAHAAIEAMCVGMEEGGQSKGGEEKRRERRGREGVNGSGEGARMNGNEQADRD